MKKKFFIIVPLIIAVFGIFMFHFSCSKEDKASSLFGNARQSPMRNDSDAVKSFEIQESFRKIFDLNKDTVVFITTEQVVKVQPHPFYDDPFLREFFGTDQQPTYQKRKGLGSGFVLSEDGYICTNYHVVGGVTRVSVKVNEKEYRASVVGFDKRTDIALLKINAGVRLKPAYFGDSDKVRVGDWAIAIGNPFGLDKTFTVGVISAIGRKDVEGGSYIQTDASINPGNSGGPLINIYGEVIGINRMIYSQSGGYMGIGFAIPFNTAKDILASLKKGEKIKKGYIGVSVVPIPDNYAKELGLDSNRGAFVGEIIPDSPAAKAGVKVGDVILKVDDRELSTANDLFSFVSRIPVGRRTKLTLWRNRGQVVVYAAVEERPDI